jgi:hypothetical protein
MKIECQLNGITTAPLFADLSSPPVIVTFKGKAYFGVFHSNGFFYDELNRNSPLFVWNEQAAMRYDSYKKGMTIDGWAWVSAIELK